MRLHVGQGLITDPYSPRTAYLLGYYCRRAARLKRKEKWIMSNFIALISLVGDWLLFSFPLYQGLMELKEFKSLLEEFEQVSKRWKPISPWWWLLPPLKVHKERVRGNHILREAADTKHERHQAINFLDKATAWYFVALAGWLKMLTSSYELLENYELKQVWILIGLVVVLTLGGIFNAYYRIDSKRVSKKEAELDSDPDEEEKANAAEL